ncbi:MAG: AraC family transcriptional regulator [Bacteroidia bacterium]
MDYFHFNQYSSLLLPGWVQGLVFFVLLLGRSIKWERPADRFGAFLLLACTLYVSQWMLGFAGWYDAHTWQTTVMFYTPWANFTLFGPLVYFTFISLTNAQFEWKKQYWLHFAPFLLLSIEPLVVFGHDMLWEHWLKGNALMYFDGTRGSWAEYINTTSVPLLQFLHVFERIHLLAYLVLTILSFNQYRKYLRENFTNEDRYALGWLRMLLFVFVIGFGLSWLTNVLSWVIELDYVGSWYSHFIMSLTIYMLSVRLYALGPERLRALRFEPGPVSEAITLRDTPSSAEPDDEIQDLSAQLAGFLEKEKPFLDPDLNLAALAGKLKTSPAMLSKTINLIHKQNFNDYINGFRCREVIRRLEAGEHTHFTFLSIALDAGFNSKATFNRAFKKYSGESPRQFVSNHEMRRLTS